MSIASAVMGGEALSDPAPDDPLRRAFRNWLAHHRGADPFEFWEQRQPTAGPDGWRDYFRLLDAMGRSAPPGPGSVAADFFASLAAMRGATSVLDPFAVSPAVMAAVGNVPQPPRALALTSSAATQAVGQKLAPGVEWRVGPLTAPLPLEERFDLVVCAPPIGFRADPPRPRIQELAYAVLLDATELLTESGVAAFLLPDAFLAGRQSAAVRDRLAARGLHVEAAISIEGGLRGTEIATSVFVVSRRAPDAEVFVARVSPAISQEAVLKHLAERRNGPALELGWLYPMESYRGWQALSAEAELLRTLPHPIRVLGDVAEISRYAPATDDPPSNAVYLPEWPEGRASTLPPPESPAFKGFVIKLNPEAALAAFVAEWMNQPLGQLGRRSWSSGATVQRIKLDDVGKLLIYCPEPAAQQEMLATYGGLRLIARDIQQRVARLWTGELSAADAANLVERLSHPGSDAPEDAVATLEQWIEALPYPLATIAYRYTAVNDTADKIARLQHLFEAFAEFLVAVLLSGIRRHPEVAEAALGKLRRAGGKKSVLDRPDYNSWVQMGRSLSKPLRQAADRPDAADVVSAMFGSISASFVTRSCNAELWDVIDKGRLVRNDRYHGGIEEGEWQRGKLARLEGVLRELRELTAGLFDDVEVVRPQRSEQDDDGLFVFDRAERLVGPNPRFRERQVESSSPMKGKRLYFVPAEGVISNPLELLPLVTLRVPGEATADAVFFYNLRVEAGVRLVSYHHGALPEEVVRDEALEALIDELQPDPE